jgi:hypothetical protein
VLISSVVKVACSGAYRRARGKPTAAARFASRCFISHCDRAVAVGRVALTGANPRFRGRRKARDPGAGSRSSGPPYQLP